MPRREDGGSGPFPKSGDRVFRPALLAATALCATVLGASAAEAQVSPDQLSAIEKQIASLKAELRRLKQETAERDRELSAARQAASPRGGTPPVTQLAPVMPQIPAGYALVPASPGSAPGSVVLARAEPPPRKLPLGTFQVGAVTVTLGGYITADMVYRSRNDVDDIQSNFNAGIPERYSPLYHESEYHLSARTSRLTGLVTANPDEATKLRAYVSVDFQGGAPTSNYNQSNSWVPRLREAWASYDRADWGFEILGGQAWSLLTMDRVGMDPLNVNPPQTVDPNYLPGFTYARQAQLRFMKTFNDGQYRVAVSFENPATIYGGTAIPSSLGTLNTSNPGVGIDATGSNATTSVVSTVTTAGGKTTTTTANVLTPGNISDDIAPDIIVKATADYDRAHLEAFGVERVFHDRLSQLGTGQSNTLFGGGGGAAALIRVIPKLLDFQISGLAGRGISRYDPTQLPDASIGSHGQPVSLPGYEALAGLIGHPTPAVDMYGYIGTDQVSARYFNNTVKGVTTGYGYGNPLFNNKGCEIELSPASTCAANTSGVVQGTVGAWYRILKGPYGTLQTGFQYSYTRRFVFQGLGPTPQTDDNMVFLSFRYFPFN